MSAGRPLATIDLSPEEKKVLEEWACKRTMPKLAFRARLILACADGKKNINIAKVFHVSQSTVGKWRSRFLKLRLDGLTDKPRPGAPRKITDGDIKEVIAKTNKLIEAQAPCLSTRFIATECGLTQSTVSRIWRSYALCPAHSQKVKHSKTTGLNKRFNNLENDGFKFYKSLGSLIKDYRQRHGINQETLAKTIDISTRELQRWESNQRRAHMNNLHDLSEATGIPMQVCLALNADQPIWYSLRERRFAYSSIEISNFNIENLLKLNEQSNLSNIERYEHISKDKYINLILKSHVDIYGTERLLSKEVIKKANTILGDLNYIAFDCWGHYVGHLVCLPMSFKVYNQLKKEKKWKDYLTSDKISDITDLQEGVFFFYSAFMTNVSIAYTQLIRSAWYLAKVKQKEKYLAVYNMAAKEVKEFFSNFGATMVSCTAGRVEQTNAQLVPAMFEIKLDIIAQQLENSGVLRQIAKDKNRITTDLHPIG